MGSKRIVMYDKRTIPCKSLAEYKHLVKIEQGVYIDRTFLINIRPFPILDISLNAQYNGIGDLSLLYRTPYGHSDISNALKTLKWHPKYIEDCLCEYVAHFDLTLHLPKEIKTLFENILDQIQNLTLDVVIKDRLQCIKNEINTMLENYFLHFKNVRFTPEDHKDCSVLVTQDDHERGYNRNFRVNGFEQKTIPLPPKEFIFDEYELTIDHTQYRPSNDFEEAISDLNINKVHRLLENGANPNISWGGKTPLCYWVDLAELNSYTHSFIHGTNKFIERRRANEDHRQLLESILNLITLLIDYKADFRIETDKTKLNAFELVALESMGATNTSRNFYNEILKRLAASSVFEPQYPGIDVILDGKNLIYNDITKTKTSNILIHLVRNKKNLYFKTSDNKIITVIAMYQYELTNQNKKDLFTLFKNNFNLKYFDNDNKAYDYFMELLNHPYTVVDAVYLEGHLSGINISDSLIKTIKNKPIIVHHAKLTVANKTFSTNYPGFLSNLAFARGFALQADFPDLPVLTWLEVASVHSYNLVSDIAYPHTKETGMEDVMISLAENLYDSKKLDSTDKSYIKDSLAVAQPFSKLDKKKCWHKKHISEAIYKAHYQKDKHSLIMGFFNNRRNFDKLKNTIDSQIEGVRFMDIVEQYSCDLDHTCSSINKAKL